MHRISYVFDFLLTQIVEHHLKLVAYTYVHNARDANAARFRKSLQPRRDIHSVTVDVVAFDDHIAKIDADAEVHAAVIWLITIAFRHAFLDFDSTLDGIDNARELDQ